MKFAKKIGNIELRTVSKFDPHTTAEIVKCEDESRYTLAYWKRKQDDIFDLTFVGNRPFNLKMAGERGEKNEFDNFLRLCRIGQNLLENKEERPIIVDVKGGIAYCDDPRVEIIDHDQK